MGDRTGQQLGSYQLIRLLGRGGFADVYLGEHIYLKTQVAIKILQMRLTNEDMEDFLKEARTIAHLIHHNIVRVMDFGIEGETPFLVMDYAPMGTLRQRHPRGTRLSLTTIVPYIKQISAALQYAHDEKLIHRDVKPENMLLGRYNDVLLSDFGIALIAQSSRYQTTQDVVGTIAYMSPEQIQGKPRPASDQYALGIVVYEWLTGERPFHGSFTELCAQHMFAPPPSLREKAPALPPTIEEVLQIALAKDPKQRFMSVRAFATALEQACQFDAPTFVKPPALEVQPLHMKTSSETPVKSPPTPLLPPIQPSTAPKAVGTIICTYRGHSRGVNAITWSPDGKRIASGSDDGTVQVWDAVTGDKVITYKGHDHWVRAVAWSPDGAYIASGSDDRTVQIWNAANGNKVYTYDGHSHWVNALAWSSDSKHIASGSNDKTVQVWDIASRNNVIIYRGHSDTVLAVAWSPDSKYIASGGDDKTVQIWGATNGDQISTYRNHSGTVNTVAWSPNGQHVASGGTDSTVEVWNTMDGNKLGVYRGHSASVLALEWSHNGKYIASTSVDSTVGVWEVTTGNKIFTYRGHSEFVRPIAWSPNDNCIASGSWDGTIHIWVAPKLFY